MFKKITLASFKKPTLVAATAFIVVMGGFFVANSIRAAGPAAVDLGAASNFVILTKTGITNVPTSHITGNIGTSLDQASTDIAFAGITCGEVTGSIYSFNSTGPLSCVSVDATLIGTAVGNMMTAYTNASSPATPAGVGAANLDVGSGTLSGNNFVPGTYTWTSGVTITNDITLTGGPSDVWIFQVAGTLNIASGKKITLAGGALPQNIFWQVTGAVTLVTGSTFEGNILAQTSIAMQAGAILHGRALAQTEVTLNSNTISANAPTPTCTTTCYTDTVNGNDTNGGTSTSDAKKSIQASVTQVSSGGTVNVAAGTYIEQINVNKNLTLTGAGSGTTTIQAPGELNNDPDGAKTLVLFTGPITASISDFTIQGPVSGLNFGIYVRDGATVNIYDNTVKDIRDNPLSGAQQGYGIEVGKYNNTFPFVNQVGHATITNNIVLGYQKTGIEIEGAGSGGTISGNTVTGAGVTSITSQNGIQIRRGATGSIINNTVTDNAYTGHEVNATGISVTYPGNNVIVQNNTVNHNTANIYTYQANGVQILNNQVSDSAVGRIVAGITADSDDVATNSVGITVTITGNSVKNNLSGGTNQGPGIFLWGIKSGTVSNNIIAGSGDDGILIGASGNVAITGNTFSEIGLLNTDPNTAAIDFGGVIPELESYGFQPNSLGGFSVHNNSFIDNRNSIWNYDSGSVNATNNWWGVASPSFSTIISGDVSHTPWYTDAGMTTLSGFPVTNGSNGYLTIQAAVASASAGDTINIAAGTYTETGQIVINKNLNIVGADKATTIIKPAQDTGSSGDARGWFLVPLDVTFNLSNVTLDGTGHKIYMGLYYWGNGTVNNSNITNIKYNESGPDYQGRGMIIKGNVNVTNSTFTQTGRIGVQYYGGGGTVDGNKFTGKGAGNWLDYGVELENGAIVTISNNTISGDTGVAAVDNSTSAGILMTTYFGSGTTATITGNTVTGNTDGIVVGDCIANDNPPGSGCTKQDTSTATANQNNLSGNISSGLTSTSSTAVNATNNWWGVASPSFSTIISGNANHTPWYINNELTTLSNNVPTDATYTSTTDGQADLPAGATNVVLTNDTTMDLSGSVASSSGGNIVVGGVTKDLSDFTSGDLAGKNLDLAQTVGDKQITVDQAVTLQSGTDGDPILLTNSNLSNVVVSIPDGTTILAPTGWDGTIDPPTAGSSSGETAPSGFSVGSTVIDVGSPNVVLLFDQAVKITLTGVTGTVGYKPAGSDTWKTITTQCTSADVPGISFPGECYFPDGGNTIIWTYHFTSFGGLNVVPSGNNPGGYYSYSPTQVPSSIPTTTPQGQVLGAAITKGDPANLTVNGLKEGDAVSARGTGDPDIYAVNKFGYKRLFLNPVIFNMYGQLKNIWGKVRSVIASSRDSFPTSGLFRNCEINDSKVYAIETTGEDTAVLHWVNLTGDQAVAQDSEFFKKVFCINSKEFNWYSKSSVNFTALSQMPVYSR